MRAAVLLLVASACGTDGQPQPQDPLYPLDYAATYQQVRDCRRSIDHDLMSIRVLASPDALGPYTNRDQPIPEGGILLKEQFDLGDETCSGPIRAITVAQKLAPGSDPVNLDWVWQKTDPQHKVITDYDVSRCSSCHTTCGVAPDGFDGMCAVP